ncbi:MAG: hypothetical protein WKF83_17030, partial [Nocardioidaceae bacterium]
MRPVADLAGGGVEVVELHDRDVAQAQVGLRVGDAPPDPGTRGVQLAASRDVLQRVEPRVRRGQAGEPSTGCASSVQASTTR